MRRSRALVAVLAVLAVLTACSTGQRQPSTPARSDTAGDAIRVGAFNFPESRVLAELYRQALAAAGFPTAPVAELGSREIVSPAIRQGRIDLIPEYTGSALTFARSPGAATGNSGRTYQRLAEAVTQHGLTVAAPAPAQNQNAFAVSQATAEAHGLAEISDLEGIAGQLTFGGPPECPERPTCLVGLRERYDVTFGTVRSIERGDHVAAALDSGEIDVGLLFTTDPTIDYNDFVILDDDRALQPAENVVPLLRTELVKTHGTKVVEVLDAVSAKLTTAELAGLNQQVGAGKVTPAEAAAAWLAGQDLTP